MNTASVIVPCYNEQETLREFHRRVKEVAAGCPGVSFEFIFVNDCSSDATGEILHAIADADSRIKVLELAVNSGHQKAVTAGLDFAEGEAVIIIDGDLQDPPELIPEMLALIDAGFDVVHAQRRARAGESWFKLATAKIFYAVLGKLSTTRIIENCGDFRAVSSRVAKTMQRFREPHRFLRGLFAMVGFRQCILRFDRHERFAGRTKYSLKKMVKLASDALFSFSTAPIRAILWFAAGLWAMSLLYLAITLYQWLIGRTVAGWTSIVILLTVFTGVILASISVVGSYVGRIFQQGQHRPLYWLANTRNIRWDGQTGIRPLEVELAKKISDMSSSMGDAGLKARPSRIMPVFEQGTVMQNKNPDTIGESESRL